MNYLRKLSVRIMVALAIGLLFAVAGTKIMYACVPVGDEKGCTLFAKAVTHPSDLLHNKQDSLVKFSANFAVASLVAFALLSAASFIPKKRI